ncbi:MAG: aminoglycoside phosphotransferase family protein [Dehalococcoidia bacterium]
MIPHDALSEPEIGGALLAYLRGVLQAPELSYAEAPSQITGGYDTLVFGFRLSGAPEPFAGPLILRVFREADSGERARYENAVHDTVVALGYPAPRILLAEAEDAPLGRAFLVMVRLPGRTMLEMFFRPSRLIFQLAPLLAAQHVLLHRLNPQPLIEKMEAERLNTRVSVDLFYDEVQQRIERAQLHWLAPGMRWLLAERPASTEQVICHGDFHPANMLVDKGAVSGVIDWAWVSIAEPAYDVGASVAIFTHGPVNLPGFLRGPADLIRRRFIRRYVAEYQKRGPLDLAAVDYYEALRCLGFLMEVGEQWQADAGVIERPAKPSAFTGRDVGLKIASRFQALTGVALELPSSRG